MTLFVPDTASRIIGVEEHYATEDLVRRHRLAETDGYAPIADELLDIGEGRVRAMDEAGVDMQVLSLTSPGIEPLEPAEAIPAAREANAALAAAVSDRPGRFAGLAALPLSSPEAAATELGRVIGEGFVGANINGHTRGRYLDHPVFEPLLGTAQRLGVPLYLHPAPPPPAVVEANYAGNFPAAIRDRFAGAGWGWHHETGTHALRMILGGVFDRFPDLQVMLGHHGETLPLLVPRIERNFPRKVTGLQRPLRDYLRQNFFYTFGGWNWVSMFEAVRRLVGTDRILFSTDYPYGNMTEAHTFLGHLELSGPDRELIAHGNAERLLHIPEK